MRFLHSSDWHLGRSFGPLSLQDEQSSFVHWFVDAAISESVELAIIAGDVYDRAVPPTWAVELFRDVLVRLHRAGVQVVVIAGNHDGPERMTAYDELVDASGVHVRGGYARAGEVLRLTVGDGAVDVVPVPYLDPVLAPEQAVDEAGECGPELGSTGRRRRATHHQVLAGALREATSAGVGPRSIVVAHAFVINTSGASGPVEPRVIVSDSERQLTVGGTASVSSSLLRGYSYAALGHLHAPQCIGADTIRYSGSPLAYSFSETGAKQIVLVEVDRVGTATAHEIAVPIGRGVATITGHIDQLLTASSSGTVDRYVRAVITDPGPVIDAKRRLQLVYPNVVEIELRPERSNLFDEPEHTARRRHLQPAAIVEAFWLDMFDRPPDHAERSLLLAGLDSALQT